MREEDELQALRAGVSCAAVLENMTSGWKLDARQSTRRALKYRRGAGEVLIVNHDGRGWWDPLSDAKGDVFTLVQHLEPGLNFGQVRQVLRRFLGLTSTYAAQRWTKQGRGADRTPAERWELRPRLRPGSAAWVYLTGERALPPKVLEAAAAQDAAREGPHGSAWFAHRRGEAVSHVEIRGPAYKGSVTGGRKALFRFGRTATARLVIAEAPIDALSVTAIESLRPDTVYVATGGGMGPGTIEALTGLLAELAHLPDALAVGATDANVAGDRYAERHLIMARSAGVPFARLRPPEGLDWNDVLRRRGLSGPRSI